MKKPTQSPKSKAKARYNKLVDYCTENVWGNCGKCPYPAQCLELTELGLSPGSGIMFDQNYTKDKVVITRILGVSAKELSRQNIMREVQA